METHRHARPYRQPTEQTDMMAESAGLAALSSLAAFGPATAHALIDRVARAASVAGEPTLPFKYAVLYAVLHELEFEGLAITSDRRDSRRVSYSITSDGRAFLSAALERWRAAHLVIRASGAQRETARS